jgi:hypothetical protein
MIRLESAHIEEVRGIRNLDIDFGGKTFAISGPNGCGKSGVIDAVEFGLTGQIGRLTGRGAKGLTVAEHGPHVDKTKFPDAAFVELKVSLPALSKAATITRKVSAPKKPEIVPNDPDVLAALTEVADHPEITLSRREILRFILIEPAKRSDEIQTILKLEEIGQTRSAFNTAQNRLSTAARNAATLVNTNRDLPAKFSNLTGNSNSHDIPVRRPSRPRDPAAAEVYFNPVLVAARYARATMHVVNPSRSIVHQGYGSRAADQTTCRFSADDLPGFFRSATTSKAIFCPSLRARIPARSTALMCTKISLPPSSGWIKPKPLWSLKNFTVPRVI